MRLDQCDLDGIGAISMAPFERNAPEEEWVSALNAGLIPHGLYGLYQRAHFLSFGKAPRFLSDGENILFSFFGLVLRSIQESLVDADEQARLFVDAHKLVYDPMKMALGETWDKSAPKREKRHFRDLLIALQTSLDALADTVAIFFPGCIKGLEAGRAQFSRIEDWVQKPFPLTSVIVSPSEFYLSRLYGAIQPLINAPAPEKDWLRMMRLLRNKAAHLGDPLFRQLGLPRAGDGRLFAFLPRQWPFMWESLIEPTNKPPSNPSSLPEYLRENLMRQDIVSCSRGLLVKINAVVEAASVVLNEAYEQFKDLPENQSALLQLKSNFERYDFESFVDLGKEPGDAEPDPPSEQNEQD